MNSLKKSGLPPNPYSNLLGYQSVNVIDPSYMEFMRNFVVDDYYLSIYGTKLKDDLFSVQYTKKYADGRTIWYTETLSLKQINNLLEQLENSDRLTEYKMGVIESIRKNAQEADEALEAQKRQEAEETLPTRLFLKYNPHDTL